MVGLGMMRRELAEARDDLIVADGFGAMGEAVMGDLVGLVGDHPLWGGLEECLQREGHYRREALVRVDRLSKWVWAMARAQGEELVIGPMEGQMELEFAA